MADSFPTQFNKLQKALGKIKAVSIRFSNQKPSGYNFYQDTACTSLARSLIYGKSVAIDRYKGQLCSGGEYFLQIKKVPPEEVKNVYVKDEQVFKSNETCAVFLKQLPKYPQKAKKKYVLISPMQREKGKPDVITFLCNPAQAGRILGLSVFTKMRQPHIMPAGSTCMSLFASLSSSQIHLNFIDYFDRYYQGKQQGKLIWNDGEMLVSLPYRIFTEIYKNLSASPHGTHKPRCKPREVEKF